VGGEGGKWGRMKKGERRAAVSSASKYLAAAAAAASLDLIDWGLLGS